MKTLKISSLALMLALVGGQANASDFAAPSAIGVGQSYTFENGLVAAGSNSFSDNYLFTLASGVTGVSFLFNIGLPSYPIASFNVSYSGNPVIATGGNVSSTYSSTDEDGFAYTFTMLDKAEYTFKLTGLTAGPKVIHLSGAFEKAFPEAKNYSMTVSAVPEPESYAMLLAGLCLMAGIARRKSKSN